MRIEGRYNQPLGTFDEVRVNDKVLSPARSQRIFNHSPDGFAWGYHGSGPAQLALALLLQAGVSKERAVRLHQKFKAEHIATLPTQGSFNLELDVFKWALDAEENHGEK